MRIESKIVATLHTSFVKRISEKMKELKNNLIERLKETFNLGKVQTKTKKMATIKLLADTIYFSGLSVISPTDWAPALFNTTIRSMTLL